MANREYTEASVLKVLKNHGIMPKNGMFDFSTQIVEKKIKTPLGDKIVKKEFTPKQPGIKLLGKISFLVNYCGFTARW